MRSVTRATRTLSFALAAGLGFGLLGCGAGGGGSGDFASWGPHPDPGESALKVTLLDAQGRTTWERNAPLEFLFSVPLHPNSLEPKRQPEKAIQVSIITAGGRIPARGSFSFKEEDAGPGKPARTNYRKVIFDPTRTSAGVALGCADIPFGFQAFTTYTVSVPAPPAAARFLTSRGGKPISESFTSFFTTSDKYVREFVQPSFIGFPAQSPPTGALGFDPPPFAGGLVAYNARVLIVFDEAMDPISFDPGTNILIKNETLSNPGQTVLVGGTFTSDACGRTWKFTPAFSFGGQGYTIAVILTGNLKDLAGNPLANPKTIRFNTEVKPGVPTVNNKIESFDNQTMRDAPNTTADWGVGTPGQLKGGAVTSTSVIVKLDTNLGPPYTGGVRTQVRDHPFFDSSSPFLNTVGHDLWTYTQAELGAAGAITDIGWGPSSNALFASTHSRVTVIVGHASNDVAGTNFSNNFDVGSPVTVTDALYVIPQRANIEPPGLDTGYWPFPIFSSFFEYNGKNNLAVDVNSTQGTNYQITRIYFGPIGFPNRHAWGVVDSTQGVGNEPVVTDMKFTKKRRTTVAQSLFYDTFQINPDYSTPIESPFAQAAGTSLGFEFEGAEGILFPIPGNPNNVIPNPSTFTGWVTNIDQLDGYRFFRFRATLIANVSNNTVPILNSITFPYIF